MEVFFFSLFFFFRFWYAQPAVFSCRGVADQNRQAVRMRVAQRFSDATSLPFPELLLSESAHTPPLVCCSSCRTCSQK